MNLFIFPHAPKQNFVPDFYHHPPGRRKLPIPVEQRFLKIYFLPSRKGGGGRWWDNYGVAKITKTKPTRVLVTSFDKLHYLCNLYIFDFSFVVP